MKGRGWLVPLFYQQPAMSSGASHVISLGLCGLIYKMGIMIPSLTPSGLL